MAGEGIQKRGVVVEFGPVVHEVPLSVLVPFARQLRAELDCSYA